MSSGQKMTFRWYYKQRYELPKPDKCTNLYSYAGSQYVGRTNQDHYVMNMRTYGMTNACWAHNWMTDIMFWDAPWEAATKNYPYQQLYPVFYLEYEALVFRPEGGIYYFLNTANQSVLTEPQSQVSLKPLSSYPLVATNWPTADANGIYWGDAGMGFKLTYPDGSQDIFSLTFYVMLSWGPPIGYWSQGNWLGANSTAHALLTQRLEPAGAGDAPRVRVCYKLTDGPSRFPGKVHGRSRQPHQHIYLQRPAPE